MPVTSSLMFRGIEAGVFYSLGYNLKFADLDNSIFSRRVTLMEDDPAGGSFPQYQYPTNLDFEVIRIMYSDNNKKLIRYGDISRFIDNKR
jgi:hypothetical protein